MLGSFPALRMHFYNNTTKSVHLSFPDQSCLSLIFNFREEQITSNMDITKATNAKKLDLCQTYFRAGWACLPFVWAINVFWFFDEAFRVPPYPEQEKIRKYVIMSLIGALVWIAIIISWVIVFQTNRAEWGEIADHMSFIIPAGKA